MYCVEPEARHNIRPVSRSNDGTDPSRYGWDFALEYHGQGYVWGIFIVNVLAVVLLSSLYIVRRGNASRVFLLFFATLEHCWLFWFAFPYLGELPYR